MGGGFNDRALRSNEGFLIGDFVVGRDIREVEDLVSVKCDMATAEGRSRLLEASDSAGESLN